MPHDLRQQIISRVFDAFAGVPLGAGRSLEQAAMLAIDSQAGEKDLFRKVRQGECLDDWRKITDDDLEAAHISHLDAAGFRYYLPALMLSVLKHYDPNAMRVIKLFSALCPEYHYLSYHLPRYAELNARQEQAVAFYLHTLPQAGKLCALDQENIQRGLKLYWGIFLGGYQKPYIAEDFSI